MKINNSYVGMFMPIWMEGNKMFAHGVMDCRIILHGRPIELFLVPASAPQLV